MIGNPFSPMKHALGFSTALALMLLTALSGRANPEPIYPGLGTYHRTITTSSPEAQRYFDQGLAFLHGFNHGAAIRSFQQAAQLDPACATAHWGVALACGPHINAAAVPPPMAQMAWDALALAQQNAASATPLERALIEALGQRYANPQPEDRKPLDRAYADAMRQVWLSHSSDPDVGALFAEAMMNLRPWDLWTADGQPQPGTEEIVATLEAVLKLAPEHPFANHLYVHAVEASPEPGRADEAANRLRRLQPGLAHNVHMPSHIDIRRGRWAEAIASNLKAIEADGQYAATFGAPKDMLVIYAAHNRHMLVYAAMMTGQGELALQQIRAMVASIPPEFMKAQAKFVEGFAAHPLEVMVRFGRWDDILAEPDNYAEYMPFCRAFHHAARAIAFAAKGDLTAARAAQATYLERVKLVPADEVFGNNKASAIVAVITPMVEGELLVAEGKFDAGIESLRAASQAEDLLKYEEPPGWLIPVRHALGVTLLRARRFAEAEQVYRDDLAHSPNNGWSLLGLTQSLRKQNRSEAEIGAAEAQFRSVWAQADAPAASSCLCQPTP